jgi:hypothetical protein
MAELIRVRDARDRLIEILGMGTPYPLQDLPVDDEQLTVPFNNTASIPIRFSQRGVLYQLYHDGQPVKRTAEGKRGGRTLIEAEGNGDTLHLETYKITDDITFQIHACKLGSQNSTYLHQTATIKVGLDVSLRAWVQNAAPLDPAVTDASSPAARIVDYGEVAEVVVEKSQEGVLYQLVAAGNEAALLSQADVIGTLDNIILKTKAVTEDITILIRATKDYEETNKPSDVVYLTLQLPLKARANPALAVSAQPTIAAYNSSAIVKVMNSQRSVRYQAFAHQLRHAEFMAQTNVIAVAVPGEPDVHVAIPPDVIDWQTIEGYVPAGEAKQGTGAALELQVSGLIEDTLLIVQASKQHAVDSAEDGSPITLSTAVQLRQAAVVLVEPNPAQALTLKVLLINGATDGTLHVTGGQPGVFYHIRHQADGDDIALPAYFHQHDDQDPELNKGLDQLQLEVDFVIARDYPADDNLDLTRQSPPDPIVETDPLSDTTLFIYAVKARTRVGVMLEQMAHVTQFATIRLQDSVVDYGTATKILVENSQIGEKYQPLLNGEIFKRALNGNGETLSFNTDALQADTHYDVEIISSGGEGLAVERTVRLLAQVRPPTDSSTNSDPTAS